jgi:hypothetical protein
MMIARPTAASTEVDCRMQLKWGLPRLSSRTGLSIAALVGYQ